jgi:predicted metal-dependent enzyme (double-stranded beta helix superfamily)
LTFDLEQLTADCTKALTDSTPSQTVSDIVSRAVSDAASVIAALGQPTQAEIQRLHVSSELTILNVVWAPRMTIRPHNHNMWAVIGVYGGREDNIFWRRCKDAPRGRVEAAGAKSLGPGDVRPLGREIIHSVTNPTSLLTGAIHIYGGDFFAVERSEWDPENLEEHPYDVESTLQLFADANRTL